MINAISKSTPVTPDAQQPRRSPSMDAQLSDARAKLDDWITCPSAKTPEGKNEIKKATAQVNTVKAEIKKADDANTRAVAAQSTDSTARPADSDDGLAALARRNPAAAFFQFGSSQGIGSNVSIVA